ncbi:MAG: hypothetical protein OEY52_01625 [Gammaproteobacteria bacterium]|nr:hypothetical protein [Gammaproteobacteria bacterium]
MNIDKEQSLFYLSLFTWAMIFILITPSTVHARTPSANRECSTCHIMWLNEFKQKDKATLIPYDPRPVVATGKQDVSSTEMMCFSCHDGFVLDSRFMWQKGKYRHPVGQKPTDGIKIPLVDGKQMFPLNDEGKVYCGTCHSAHGVDWGQSESAVFLRMKNVNSSLCMTCHKERTGGPKHGNHPVNKSISHPPKTLFKVGSKFGSDGRVVCETCHRPHGANEDKILVIKNNESDLCRSCHDDKKTINQTKHNMALSNPRATNFKGKTASETGPCSVCHVPHDAKGAALWARERIETEDAAASPCLGCHNEKGLAKDKPIKQHSHPTQVAIKELGISVTEGKWMSKHSPLIDIKQKALPLYNQSGQRVKHGGNVSCGTCHDPHVWAPGKTALVDQSTITDQEGNGQNSFLRITQGKGSDLCINCHVDKQSLFFSKHNREIGFRNKPKDERGHDGICAECHMAHNGKGAFMHAKADGEGKGAVERVCTACHKQGGIADKKLTGTHSHPIGVSMTKLGNSTNLPLFTAEGKRHPDGNVDCASCHNVHQWDPKNRKAMSGAKLKSEGNGKTSFLRVRNTKKSELCTTCHQQQKTILKTEHNLNITHQKSTNLLGQAPHRSGVCGACHSVHQAQTSIGLWARKPFKDNQIKNSLCLSCHNKAGLASNKVPPYFTHPEQVLALSERLRRFIGSKILPYIPVFSEQGHSESMGEITCTSCHDPHRWTARSKMAPGKNTEGTVLTSFLRNSSSENIVCADCHGKDALFRYKYFHSKTSRKRHPLSE